MSKLITPVFDDPLEAPLRAFACRVAPSLSIVLHVAFALSFRILVGFPFACVLAYGIKLWEPDLNLWRAALVIAVASSVGPVFQSCWTFIRSMRKSRRERVSG